MQIPLNIVVLVNVSVACEVEVPSDLWARYQLGEIDAGDLACEMGPVRSVRRVSRPSNEDVSEAMGNDFDAIVYALEVAASD